MKTGVKIVPGLAAVMGHRWPFFGLLLILPFVVAACGPIALRPGPIPDSATAEWDFKDGTDWRWRREFPDGCAEWSGNGRFAYLFLSADRADCKTGRGVGYFTFEDDLVFQGYWPKPSLGGGAPCPQAVSPAQIAELRKLAGKALGLSVTAAEKVVLRRVDQRLATAQGDALTTDASGWCNDLKPEDYHHARDGRYDLWR